MGGGWRVTELREYLVEASYPGEDALSPGGRERRGKAGLRRCLLVHHGDLNKGETGRERERGNLVSVTSWRGCERSWRASPVLVVG